MKGNPTLTSHNNVGHGGWVTSMQVGEITEGDQTKEFLITGSRDKSLMIWDIQEKSDTDADKEWGIPRKVLKGMILPRPLLKFKFRSFSLH
jgi:hypothetical protein